MAEERHEAKEKPAGLGLGVNLDLGVDIDLKLAELRGTLNMLTDALRETGDMATDLIAGVVYKLREASVGTLKKAAAQEGGEKAEIYDQIVSKLQAAANRGETEARNLLSDLGESVEGAGQKMQEGAGKEEEIRH